MPWQHKICPRNQGARECYWAQPAHVLRDTGQPLNRYYMCHHWERKDPFLGQLDRQNRQAYLGLPKGTVTTLRLDDRRQDQEFSCSLGVQMPVDEPSHHAADYHNLRLAEPSKQFGQTQRDSGRFRPLKAHLAQPLSTRGKFFRPRLVISSSYACLPYVLDKRRCPTCSRLYGQLRKGPGSEQWGRGAKAPGPASTMLPSHADFDDKMLDMITDIAAAFEMVHMASLVHDDIIDGSAHRRASRRSIYLGDPFGSAGRRLSLRPSKQHCGQACRTGIAACLSDAVGLMCRESCPGQQVLRPRCDRGRLLYQTGGRQLPS